MSVTMQTYESRDLFLAAYLKAKGYPIREVRRNGNRKAVFVFEDRPERELEILDYYNGRGSIQPLAYVNAWKDLKALTYNF